MKVPPAHPGSPEGGKPPGIDQNMTAPCVPTKRLAAGSNACVMEVRPTAQSDLSMTEFCAWVEKAGEGDLVALLPLTKVAEDFDGPIESVRSPMEFVVLQRLFVIHHCDVVVAAKGVLVRHCPDSQLWDVDGHVRDAVGMAWRRFALYTECGTFSNFSGYMRSLGGRCARDVIRGLMNGWTKKAPGGADRRGKLDPGLVSVDEEWLTGLGRIDARLDAEALAVRRALMGYRAEGFRQYKAVTVFVMIAVDEMSIRAVGRELGINRELVHELEAEAREGLRRRLGPEFYRSG